MLNTTQVPIDKLYITTEQRAAISALYAKNEEITRCTFSPDPASQTIANTFLKSYGLDPEMRQRLESRWSISWSISWVVGNGLDRVHRVLFQW